MRRLVYLAQFNTHLGHNRTVLVVGYSVRPRDGEPTTYFDLPREIVEQANLICLLPSEEASGTPDKASALILKCRDNNLLRLGWAVKEQDMLLWLKDGRPEEMPEALRIEAL